MADEDILTLVQNDKGVVFNFELRDGIYNSIISLTGFDVYLNIKRGEVDVVRGKCNILDAEYGRCEYIFKEGDLSVGDDNYEAELELHSPDGDIVTMKDPIQFYVRAQID